ncbi:MAG: TolC family protein [Deltaproteobacteria bacterium]|nr:TolC family protein [Deltaproteobacteria bacterium]
MVHFFFVACAIAGADAGAGAKVRVVSLKDAVRMALAQHPSLREKRATTDAKRALADQYKAPFFPQISGSASWQRTTANWTARPGSVPSSVSSGSSSASFDSFNYWNFGATVTQLLWDFNQQVGKWRAANATADAQKATERVSEDAVVVAVRTAYFGVAAARALIGVAQETLGNQARHLAQVEGFVAAGTRPAIDLAQARTEVANARLQLVTAENSFAVAKAQLGYAIGVESPQSFDVENEPMPPLRGEESRLPVLVGEAIRNRPEFAVLAGQTRAGEETLRSARGGFWPTFGLSTALTEAGSDITAMAWNWNVAVTLSWPIFQGGLTRAAVREAQATLVSLAAQRDTQQIQVRFDVEQALLAVRGAKAELVANAEVRAAAAERLRLAEGRYAAGVGNIIELGDAQLAVTSAAALKVQIEFRLATARVQLEKALGRQ